MNGGETASGVHLVLSDIFLEWKIHSFCGSILTL